MWDREREGKTTHNASERTESRYIYYVHVHVSDELSVTSTVHVHRGRGES